MTIQQGATTFLGTDYLANLLNRFPTVDALLTWYKSIPLIQAKYQGERSTGAIRAVVLHSMEAGERSSTAESFAAFSQNPRDAKGQPRKVSVHLGCDSDSTVRTVPDAKKANHCGGRNDDTIGVEQGGFAAQSAIDWLDPYGVAMIGQQVIPLVAAICLTHDIDPVYTDWAEMKRVRAQLLAAGVKSNDAHAKGITTHNDIRLAYGGTTHTDPGAGYPIRDVVATVKAFIEELLVPQEKPEWGSKGTYTVQKGDNWYAIARKFGISLDALTEANDTTIYAPLYAGRTLTIPKAETPPVDWGAIAAFITAAKQTTVKRGDKGPVVKLLQARLNYMIQARLTEDGDFGALTETAVRAFQSRSGLVVDGVVGPKTWGKLYP